MDTTTNQVISRSLVCVWVTGIAFPPNWTTLPHGQHMYTWSPASWKSGQPSTTRLCHTLDNHPDNYPLAGQKHIKLSALTSVGILGNDYYWIDGERSIITPILRAGPRHGVFGSGMPGQGPGAAHGRGATAAGQLHWTATVVTLSRPTRADQLTQLQNEQKYLQNHLCRRYFPWDICSY